MNRNPRGRDLGITSAEHPCGEKAPCLTWGHTIATVPEHLAP